MWSKNKAKVTLCLFMWCTLVADVLSQPNPNAPGGGGPPDPPGAVPLSGTWMLIIAGAIMGFFKLAISKKSRAKE